MPSPEGKAKAEDEFTIQATIVCIVCLIERRDATFPDFRSIVRVSGRLRRLEVENSRKERLTLGMLRGYNRACLVDFVRSMERFLEEATKMDDKPM